MKDSCHQAWWLKFGPWDQKLSSDLHVHAYTYKHNKYMLVDKTRRKFTMEDSGNPFELLSSRVHEQAPCYLSKLDFWDRSDDA